MLQLQDEPNSQENILKEHIKVLELRVKELVSQNLNLVTRLTKIEEKYVRKELSNEKRRHDNPTSKDRAKKSVSRERRRMSPESQNSCEFKLSSRENSHAEMPWSAKFGHPVTEQRNVYKTGKPARKEFPYTHPGRQNITVH